MQVIQIGKAIGWVPEVADRKKAYLHLNRRIPDELKFDLNCLLFTHGKLCHECTQKGANQKRKESHESSCPLLTYCGDMFKSSSPNWVYMPSLSLSPSHLTQHYHFLLESSMYCSGRKRKKGIGGSEKGLVELMFMDWYVKWYEMKPHQF